MIQHSIKKRSSWSITTAYLGIQAVQEPFIVLYSMLALLITKNLGASPFQIAVLNMLKPTVSMFSFYWGSYLHAHTALTRPTLILFTALSTLPFLLSPMSSNVWFFIAISAWYSLCSRAAVPASLEILKWNTEKTNREKLFSQASIMAYIIGGIFSILFGSLFDLSPESWTYIFAFAAALHLSSVWIQKKLPAPPLNTEILFDSIKKVGEESSLKKPWQQAYTLMAENRDFFRFQVAFSIAGFGLMFTQPAIPSCISGLPLSYVEIFIAFSILKGLGFILTSPIWAKIITYRPITSLSSAVFFGFALFLITLIGAMFHPTLIFLAYFIYGVAQAGSHLVWNLSGPIFAGEASSAPYSSVNVLMVGLRGAIAPPLGGLIAELLGPITAIAMGGALCLFGTYIALSKNGFYLLISYWSKKSESNTNKKS